jgi:hypothetical protein
LISPISSGYSSPVYIQPADASNIQDPAVSSPSSHRQGIKKGIAEYQDSFVSPRPNEISNQDKVENESAKAAEVENKKKEYFKTNLNIEIIDENNKSWIYRYENLRMVNEAQKAEQINAFRPDQPQMKPVVDASLNAAITANTLSMIRV